MRPGVHENAPVNTNTTPTLHSLPLVARGKVRDIYAVGDDRLLMVTSDRLSAFDVIRKHAFPNAIAPIINVVMLNLAFLIVGVVVVEVIFVYPGMGQYLVDHVAKRDVPVVQAVGLIFAAVYIGLNIVADIAGIVANPRLRHPK